jgi:MbtH protein
LDQNPATKPSDSFSVVINHEEQFSIWSHHWGKVPRGWQETGVSGSRETCLAYIEEVWTDMRPLSLRKMMDNLTPDAKRTS